MRQAAETEFHRLWREWSADFSKGVEAARKLRTRGEPEDYVVMMRGNAFAKIPKVVFERLADLDIQQGVHAYGHIDPEDKSRMYWKRTVLWERQLAAYTRDVEDITAALRNTSFLASNSEEMARRFTEELMILKGCQQKLFLRNHTILG